MNVFPVSSDPIASAREFADRHVQSQLGETTAALAGALDKLNGRAAPSALSVWAASHEVAYSWLWVHLDALHREYAHRFNEPHPSAAMVDQLADQHPAGRKVRALALMEDPPSFPRSKLGREKLEHLDDQDCARQLLAWKYSTWTARGRPAVWTNRPQPAWATP